MSDPILISIIGGGVTVTCSFFSLVGLWLKDGQTKLSGKFDNMHSQIDGRMSELIEATAAAARAKGKEEGITQQKAEQTP